MGLFDFARNIGNKLFGSEDEAPQKIKEYIEEENPGVSNLDVSVEDGVATISGQADSAEGFSHWLLKFDGVQHNRDRELLDPQGFGLVEFAYAQMARAAGIEISECRILAEGGRHHFVRHLAARRAFRGEEATPDGQGESAA